MALPSLPRGPLLVSAAATALLIAIVAGGGAPAGTGDQAIRVADIPASDGTVYGLPDPNETWTAQGSTGGTARYTVSINGKQLREEPFSREPPANTTRILVVGDSFTFGEGVNASQRFTDRVERRLDRSVDNRVQVISAGQPGWGMHDYHVYLRERGMDYEPDVVVVAMSTADMLSEEQLHTVQERILADLPEELNRTETWTRVHDRTFQAVNRWAARTPPAESPLRTRAADIVTLARTHDVPLLFFAYRPLAGKHGRAFVDWTYRAEVPLVRTAGAFQHLHPANYSYHPHDNHYDPDGHRILADRLAPALRDHLDKE